MNSATLRPKPRPVSLWRRPLLVGMSFGLGYGVTQRLLDLRLPTLVNWGPSFEVRESPGTSLDSLRLHFGSEQQDLRSRVERPLQDAPEPDSANKPTAKLDQASEDSTGSAIQPNTASVRPATAKPNVAPPAPTLPAPEPSQP